MSLIFKTTTTNQDVLADGIIPLTTISRRLGRAIQSSGNDIQLLVPGYYKVDASITFTAQTAGDITLVLEDNGIPVPGITASVTATADGTYTLNLTGVIRAFCCAGARTLNLVNTSEVAITVTNVAITVID